MVEVEDELRRCDKKFRGSRLAILLVAEQSLQQTARHSAQQSREDAPEAYSNFFLPFAFSKLDPEF